jgi:hypothetical protein
MPDIFAVFTLSVITVGVVAIGCVLANLGDKIDEIIRLLRNRTDG